MPNEPIVDNFNAISRKPSELHPWTDELEAYVKDILDKSKEASDFHKKKGLKCKRLRHIWGLPSVIIPIVVTAIENSNYENKILISSSLAIATISAAIDHLFNFGKRSETHFQAMSKFDNLVTDCEEVLSMQRDYRRNPTTIITQIKMMYDSINEHAPVY